MWDGDRPLDDDQAGSTYDELYLESDEVVVPPVTRIAAYVEALIARYPDDIDRSVVWVSPPVIDEASGPIVYLLMSYGKAEEVSKYAASLAREHGITARTPRRRRWSRMARDEYALSANTMEGLVLVLPTRRGIRTAAITRSNAGASPA